ncbi:MAG: hypothetical protein LBS12_04455 [Prevotellaceae bacterium]|jgi:predicted RNA binding protein YcfA (HicA-like mRNA interferase family)|nr:hypothetical protein [Prevotellaceae bacterium]
MTYPELHELIIKNGWSFLKADGNHFFYIKRGIESFPIPYHESQKVGARMAMKIIQDMKLTQ